MNEELTNLLPDDRKKALRRLYAIRLSSIVVYLLSFLILSTVALRIPVYLYQFQKMNLQKQELALVTSRLNDTQGKEVSVRFKALNDNIAYLSRLATTTSITTASAAILAIPHQGVIISGFSYIPQTKSTGERMTLTGRAATRESLRQYVSALSSQSRNADLPISSYAKETDIPFSITVTGTLTP